MLTVYLCTLIMHKSASFPTKTLGDALRDYSAGDGSWQGMNVCASSAGTFCTFWGVTRTQLQSVSYFPLWEAVAAVPCNALHNRVCASKYGQWSKRKLVSGTPLGLRQQSWKVVCFVEEPQKEGGSRVKVKTTWRLRR